MLIVDPVKCYVLGGGALVWGVVAHRRKKAQLASWVPTTAIVQNTRRDRRGDVAAVVRFTDKEGQLRTATMPATDEGAVSLGAELEIAYNPRDPTQAFIRTAKEMKLALFIPVIAGVLLLVLGVTFQVILARAVE
jgi:hypothetical protein